MTQTIRKDLLGEGNGEFHEGLQEGGAWSGLRKRRDTHARSHNDENGTGLDTGEYTGSPEQGGME
jgi:hypothetical protein